MLYFVLYALIISVVRRCQLPRRDTCARKEWRSAGSLRGVLVGLLRKSGPRSNSTGRSHDIVLLHGKLRWGSKR